MVGDIDTNRIEAKIKEIFGTIAKPQNPAPRPYFPVDDNREPIVTIGTDKELPNSQVQLMFKYDSLPDSLRGTLAGLSTEYMLSMADMMVSQRLHEECTKPDARFSVAGCSHGDFLISATKQALSYYALPKEDNLSEALQPSTAKCSVPSAAALRLRSMPAAGQNTCRLWRKLTTTANNRRMKSWHRTTCATS